MAKYELRIKARELRSKGESVKDICDTLGLSKSTVSIWVRDIILTVEQLEKLRKKELEGSERGRIKSAFLQKQKRIDLQKQSKKEGKKTIGRLSDRELFIAGLALYWAEGSKKTRRVQVCNSDPHLVLFMITWFKEFFNVKTKQISLRVGINEIHRSREKIVKEYWSNLTKIPISRFQKTSFKKVKNSKIYANHNEHYGTLDIIVMKSAPIYYKILGLIEVLSEMPT